MATNPYALGYFDPSKIGNFFLGTDGDGNTSDTGNPYATVRGDSIGLDNNYNYAINRDGSVEQLYWGDDPGQDAAVRAGDDSYVSKSGAKTASELAAMGWTPGAKDAHGYYTPGNIGGLNYSPYSAPNINKSNWLFDKFGPQAAFTALTMGVGGAAAVGAGLSGASAGAMAGGMSGAASAGAAGGNPLTGALTGAAGGGVVGSGALSGLGDQLGLSGLSSYLPQGTADATLPNGMAGGTGGGGIPDLSQAFQSYNPSGNQIQLAQSPSNTMTDVSAGLGGGSGVNYLTGQGIQTGFGPSTGSSTIPGSDTLSGWSPASLGLAAGGGAAAGNLLSQPQQPSWLNNQAPTTSQPGFGQNSPMGPSIFDSTMGTSPTGGNASVGLTDLNDITGGTVGQGVSGSDMTGGAGGAGGSQSILGTLKGYLNAGVGSTIGGALGLGDMIGGGDTGPGGNDISFRDVLSTGTSIYQNNRASDQLRQLGQQTQRMSSLDQPQRAPYQGMLSNYLSNPQQYFQNDPFAQAMTAQYRNNVIPREVAQSGNAANVIDQRGSQFQSSLAQDYYQKAGLLSGMAGFGFPQSAYAPTTAAQLGTGSIAAGGAATAGLGNLFGQNQGKPVMQGQAGTQGLFGTGVS